MRTATVRALLLGLYMGALLLGDALSSLAQVPPGEAPALGPDRITQDAIASGQLSLEEIQRHGRTLFITPFNKLDGFGDGPMNLDDPIAEGGRPSLQGNGAFLRVNGLDAQTCFECHAIVSTATVPFSFGVGGAGGANTNVIARPTLIDVGDGLGVGTASFDGRFINPPFVFGAGGIELLAKEMTADLQRLKAAARSNPGTDVNLVAKGVSFGVLRFDNGDFDTSRVEGIDADLVVRPFGRKGEFTSTRAFAVGAMAFHFGMQPVELVGQDEDADGDGVVNELLVGELSALSIFTTTLEAPRETAREPEAFFGAVQFDAIGCADCHVPSLYTNRPHLTYSFPEEPAEPFANVFYQVDLTAPPASFMPVAAGGVEVALFSDLKRHEMGPGLAESTGSPLDAQFITARLWGVADTAPYLHDGRALTLTDAILQHGGDAVAARDAFARLQDDEKIQLLAFLRSLRTPEAGVQLQ